MMIKVQRPTNFRLDLLNPQNCIVANNNNDGEEESMYLIGTAWKSLVSFEFALQQ